MALAAVLCMAATDGTEGSGTGSAVASTFASTFNFKVLKPDAYAAMLKELEENSPELDLAGVKAQYVEVMGEKKDKDGKAVLGADNKPAVELKGYKRKSITAQLSEPDFFANLDTIARQILRDAVSNFVKSAFIDQYKEIGAHDWSTISAELARVGTRGIKLDVEDGTYKELAKLFGNFILQKYNRADVAERMAKAWLGKFTRSAIQATLNKCDPGTIDKVVGNLEEFAVWVAEHSPDSADDVLACYNYHADKLGKLRVDLTTDFSAVL